jgi:hypothetical protein
LTRRTHASAPRCRLGILGAIATVSVIALSPTGASAKSPPIGKCSTAGLRFTSASGGATFSVKVISLSAGGVKCSVARSLVGQVAKDLLADRALPAHLRGLAVAVNTPCAGCSPRYAGTATGPEKRVTFVIAGGA